jgi:hypothetical protein
MQDITKTTQRNTRLTSVLREGEATLKPWPAVAQGERQEAREERRKFGETKLVHFSICAAGEIAS